jgi:hypothetical protein
MKTVAAIWLTALMMNSTQAQIPQWAQAQAGNNQPVQLIGGIQPTLLPENAQLEASPVNYHPPRVTAGRPIPGAVPIHECYPQTGAALYPSPIPNVPYQVGSTLHTNQAFYPHEMLYPHRYTAMYPPFYYVVRGGWIVTPWGVRSSDQWHLEGTRVDVKYKAKYGLFSGFHGVQR